MAYRTLSQITQDTIGILSQATGVGVQRYAEPRINLLVNLTFEMLIIRRWWPNYMRWYTACPLDGTIGVVTTDISAIKRFQDVRGVFQAGSDQPLPVLPSEMNPGDIADAQLMFVDSYEATNPEKVFRVWSPTATGNLSVHARIQPDRYVADDLIRFDNIALMYGCAWAYAEDDADSPGAAQKFQTLFENRVRDIEAELNNQPISLDKTTVKIPSQWWVK